MELCSKASLETATSMSGIGAEPTPTLSIMPTHEAQRQFLYTKFLKNYFATLRESQHIKWTLMTHCSWLERCEEGRFVTGDSIWRLFG